MKTYFNKKYIDVKDLTENQAKEQLNHLRNLKKDGFNAQRSLASIQAINNEITEIKNTFNLN